MSQFQTISQQVNSEKWKMNAKQEENNSVTSEREKEIKKILKTIRWYPALRPQPEVALHQQKQKTVKRFPAQSEDEFCINQFSTI